MGFFATCEGFAAQRRSDTGGFLWGHFHHGTDGGVGLVGPLPGEGEQRWKCIMVRRESRGQWWWCQGALCRVAGKMWGFDVEEIVDVELLK